jgi:hypothetical protein
VFRVLHPSEAESRQRPSPLVRFSIVSTILSLRAFLVAQFLLEFPQAGRHAAPAAQSFELLLNSLGYLSRAEKSRRRRCRDVAPDGKPDTHPAGGAMTEEASVYRRHGTMIIGLRPASTARRGAAHAAPRCTGSACRFQRVDSSFRRTISLSEINTYAT